MNDHDFAAIWEEAKTAGQNAAIEMDAKIGQRDACGFAWITMPGNIAFARWAKKQGLTSKGYPTGYTIWYSKVHSLPTQSVSVHEAACQVASKVLQMRLGESCIYSASRLD